MLRHILAHPEIYEQLNRSTGRLAAAAPANISVNRSGSMMTWFFTDADVTDYQSAKSCDTKRFGKFFHAMLERGIYLPPSQFEALFVSVAHSEADIDRTVSAARESFEIALS
jgi:glutamate-1-semialdehyde 2,1-aminomutase